MFVGTVCPGFFSFVKILGDREKFGYLMSRYFSERLILEDGSAMNDVVRAMELRTSLTAAV